MVLLANRELVGGEYGGHFPVWIYEDEMEYVFWRGHTMEVP